MMQLLVESQTGNSSNDPLIVWFNGGPGCSSLGGMFEELGPFYVNSDRKTLYENIYAWNKYANVLAIESPIGVGFSYNVDDPTSYTVGDNLTAQQNHDALADFFNKVQPRYKNRQWFVAGESYAGIYIPTVTRNVFQSIVAGSFPNPNFGGIAIGNGYMNIKILTNSLVLWTNYHGLIGLKHEKQWRDLKQSCCPGVSDMDNCDFAANFNYVFMNDTKNNDCANKVVAALNLNEDYSDPYDFYQDCYSQNQQKQTRAHLQKGLLGMQQKFFQDQSNDKIYYDSSDNQFGYPCDNGDRARAYFRQPEVLTAFRIDDAWKNAKLNWSGCK
uniref:Carboxypeptidase n=1 Tax=Panagrolaimus davidi TaxID=227884 RepID=A0A914PI63_9BILA